MLKFTINNKVYEFQFNGYKIIQSTNPNRLIKELMISLNNQGINIDQYCYKSKNCLIIDECTKIETLFNFTKTNFLTNLLSEELLNYDEQLSSIYDEILLKINSYLGFNYVFLNQDLAKSITSHYDFNGDSFLTYNQLKRFLSIPQKTKQLIIINDFVDLNLQDLNQYLNYFDFIIITNDCFKYIDYGQQLESVCIINENDYIDILDYEQLINAIESFINEPIDNNDWIELKNLNYSCKLAKIKYCFQNLMFKK